VKVRYKTTGTMRKTVRYRLRPPICYEGDRKLWAWYTGDVALPRCHPDALTATRSAVIAAETFGRGSTKLTHEEWFAEGTRRFGSDQLQWRFVCPSCGHVASVLDWKDAGSSSANVGFSCVGRWIPGSKEMGQRPGPCNYAGGGLFRINPVVVVSMGKETAMFAFADPPSGPDS